MEIQKYKVPDPSHPKITIKIQCTTPLTSF